MRGWGYYTELLQSVVALVQGLQAVYNDTVIRAQGILASFVMKKVFGERVPHPFS